MRAILPLIPVVKYPLSVVCQLYAKTFQSLTLECCPFENPRTCNHALIHTHTHTRPPTLAHTSPHPSTLHHTLDCSIQRYTLCVARAHLLFKLRFEHFAILVERAVEDCDTARFRPLAAHGMTDAITHAATHRLITGHNCRPCLSWSSGTLRVARRRQ